MASPPVRRLHTWAIGMAIVATGFALPLIAQTPPTRTVAASRAASRPTPTRATTATRNTATRSTATRPTITTPTLTVAVKTNPMLPPAIAIDGFLLDLTLSPTAAPTAPTGFKPLLTTADWNTYRERFGSEADGLTRQRSSGQIAFAEKLIATATSIPSGPELSADSPGLRRYLLLRAAAIAHRSREGFPTADKALTAYLGLMDKHSPAQVAALWTLSNQVSRLSVTPKPDRIRYDAVAAKANMQLALLLLESDQVEAAQAIIKQIAYHEGWLKSDPATRAQIARVRAEVTQTAKMMDYLATQYQPAIRNDVPALTAIYLYGRYVKGNLAIVADLPPRVPGSSLAQLSRALDAAAAGDIEASFTAAEALRLTAANIPDAILRARTLHAALQLYDAYMAAPETQRDRVNRTLARIAREGVLVDGARKAGSIDPFAPPAATTTAPATAPTHRTAPAPRAALALASQ